MSSGELIVATPYVTNGNEVAYKLTSKKIASELKDSQFNTQRYTNKEKKLCILSNEIQVEINLQNPGG